MKTSVTVDDASVTVKELRGADHSVNRVPLLLLHSGNYLSPADCCSSVHLNKIFRRQWLTGGNDGARTAVFENLGIVHIVIIAFDMWLYGRQKRKTFHALHAMLQIILTLQSKEWRNSSVKCHNEWIIPPASVQSWLPVKWKCVGGVFSTSSPGSECGWGLWTRGSALSSAPSRHGRSPRSPRSRPPQAARPSG